MKNPYSDSEFPWGRGFLDIVFGLTGILTMLLVLVMLLINPVGKKEEESARPVGAVTVFMDWPDDAAVDMDLWVLGPKDNLPVGYSHKNGSYFNLLRDDLGHTIDASGKNYEHAVSRGFVPGEYVVNVHWFGHGFRELEKWPQGIPVKIIVTVSIGVGENLVNKDVIVSEVIVKGYQELNVFVFTLTKGGSLDPEHPPYVDPDRKLKPKRTGGGP